MAYGKKFYKYRKQQGFSLNEAAEGITSVSSLSRWELGQGSMSIDKILLLINRIGINLGEFFHFKHSDAIYQIKLAFWKKDYSKSELLARKYLSLFHQTKNSFIDLYNAAIACNAYFILSSKNLFSKEEYYTFILCIIEHQSLDSK